MRIELVLLGMLAISVILILTSTAFAFICDRSKPGHAAGRGITCIIHYNNYLSVYQKSMTFARVHALYRSCLGMC